jgi:hypothetical protein
VAGAPAEHPADPVDVEVSDSDLNRGHGSAAE